MMLLATITTPVQCRLNPGYGAEAVPVSAGLYAVTEKQHDTHHHISVSGKSRFYADGVSHTFNGESKTIFTHDEAVAVLKYKEKDFEKDGYSARPKQPFKKRIYTSEKPASPKQA